MLLLISEVLQLQRSSIHAVPVFCRRGFRSERFEAGISVQRFEAGEQGNGLGNEVVFLCVWICLARCFERVRQGGHLVLQLHEGRLVVGHYLYGIAKRIIL